MGILANENAISAGGYQISNSLRFQSASSQYLTRTPASAGNRKTWTWSGWVKRGTLGSAVSIFGAYSSGTTYAGIFFDANNCLNYQDRTAPTNNALLTSSAVYRDPSAWYHIIVAVDTTQATASDRIKIYVNGLQVTAFSTSTYYSLNASGYVNNNILHELGSLTGGSFLDGYMAEVNFIDGQALTPSSFGETNTLTGQWVAKKYTGTYGTNGFYLPFSNGTSTTTLGYDSSGNGNNWTLTNFTRSAGVSDCWMYDVPSGNGGASGTQPNSNYCVWNPLFKYTTGYGAYFTYSNSNLTLTASSTLAPRAIGTIGMDSGQYYWEVIITSLSSGSLMTGINLANDTDGTGNAAYGYISNGNKRINNVDTAYGATYTAGDIIGVAFDATNRTLTFYKNNVSQGTITGVNAGTFVPWFYNGGGTASGVTNANFGQRSFAYTPPSGYKALCTANLPASTIVKGNKYMDATLYTGNGSTQTITNAAGFKPDWFWIKKRNTATSHVLADSVRGNTKYLYSDLTAAEATVTDAITSFNSNGFSLSNNSAVNANADTYVGWQWQAGQGTTSSNTNGSITSTVSVSTTAGFSVVTYTGTGANATVGHGLGVAPKMIICKNRTDVISWLIYHESIGATKYLEFNTSAAVTATPAWNNTAPTSSVFTVGTYTNNNGSGKNQVAYCFAEIAGFSKFGSYTGNGSADGSFVYTGFQPKWILIKSTTEVTDWHIMDASRLGYNVNNSVLYPNNSNAEQGYLPLDILSNGFKLRATSAGGNINASGQTYIYACFASNPFANSNAR